MPSAFPRLSRPVIGRATAAVWRVAGRAADVIRRPAVRVVAAHLVALFALCQIALPNNRSLLLLGYDGVFFRTTAAKQKEWLDLTPGLGSNPLQAFGNVFFCINTRYSPAYAASLAGGGEVGVVTLYQVIAFELFLAGLFLGRVYGAGWSAALLAGWGVTVFGLPFLFPARLYPMSGIAPSFLEQTAATAVLIGCWVRVGRGTRAETVAAAAAVGALATWLVVAAPAVVSIWVPVVAVFAAGDLWTAGTRQAARTKVLAAVALLVPAGVTLVPFAAGNLLNSTAALFPTELVNNRIDLTFVSVLFHGPNEGRFGRVLVVVGLLGAVAAVLGGTSTRRAGAVGLLGFAAAVIGGGLVVTYYWADYRGPSPLYYELFGWPVYFVFLAVGLERAAAAVGVAPDTWRWWVPAAAAVIPVAVVGAASFADRPEKAAYFCYTFPPRSTPIVDILRAETGIAPGVEFRGSALSLAGCSHFPNGGASWGQLVGHDAVFRVGTGNEHRAADLWHFGVPTGFEYNQFMAPAYYLMMTRMLGHPGDEQIRNVIVLRKPDPKYLASLGVRFVVTDQPQGPGVGHLRTTVPVPGSPYTLYLYEIPAVNTGQFSPTDIRVVADAAGVLAELRRPDFDYQTSAVTHEAIPETLCRAEVGRLAPVRGGYRVEARSPGTSLLVLPIQYSHCLELAPDASAGRSARLVRVNLMQAGLLFTGDYRGEIRFRNRPDGSAFRRLQDYRDMKTLGVSPAVR